MSSIYCYEGDTHAEEWWAVGEPTASGAAVKIRILMPTRSLARKVKKKRGERIVRAFVTFPREDR